MSRRDAIAARGDCQYFLIHLIVWQAGHHHRQERISFVTRILWGFAAAHGGKARPYRGRNQSIRGSASASEPERSLHGKGFTSESQRLSAMCCGGAAKYQPAADTC